MQVNKSTKVECCKDTITYDINTNTDYEFQCDLFLYYVFKKMQSEGKFKPQLINSVTVGSKSFTESELDQIIMDNNCTDQEIEDLFNDHNVASIITYIKAYSCVFGQLYNIFIDTTNYTVINNPVYNGTDDNIKELVATLSGQSFIDKLKDLVEPTGDVHKKLNSFGQRKSKRRQFKYFIL